MSRVLDAEGLVKTYSSGRGRRTTTAVAGVSLALESGASLGIVGESGCGKSTLGRLLVGLEQPSAGTVSVGGRSLHGVRPGQLAGQIQLVFQDPFSSLNPRLTVESALREVVRRHRPGLGAAEVRGRIEQLLSMVALGARFASRLPHEMSGGQAQRVAIARALAAEPGILVLDEPTSALDVSVRAEVVNLLGRLRQELQLTYVFISHDMAVIRQVCDTVGVMYLGRIVELGPWDEVLHNPVHPYTRALIEAVPDPDPRVRQFEVDEPTSGAPTIRAPTIRAPTSGAPASGALPSGEPALTVPAIDEPVTRIPVPVDGCAFAPRCAWVRGDCWTAVPPLVELRPAHTGACHVAADHGGVLPPLELSGPRSRQ